MQKIISVRVTFTTKINKYLTNAKISLIAWNSKSYCTTRWNYLNLVLNKLIWQHYPIARFVRAIAIPTGIQAYMDTVMPVQGLKCLQYVFTKVKSPLSAGCRVFVMYFSTGAIYSVIIVRTVRSAPIQAP